MVNPTKTAPNSRPEESQAINGLLAEYRSRQQSTRPLPASVAKAYELLIARGETASAKSG